MSELVGRTFFDASAADFWTFGFAILSVVIRLAKNLAARARPIITVNEAFTSFLTGALVVPFLLITLAPISAGALEETLTTNKFLLAGAGFAALGHVIFDIALKQAKPRPQTFRVSAWVDEPADGNFVAVAHLIPENEELVGATYFVAEASSPMEAESEKDRLIEEAQCVAERHGSNRLWVMPGP